MNTKRYREYRSLAVAGLLYLLWNLVEDALVEHPLWWLAVAFLVATEGRIVVWAWEERQDRIAREKAPHDRD